MKMKNVLVRRSSEEERRLPRRRSLGGGETRSLLICAHLIFISNNNVRLRFRLFIVCIEVECRLKTEGESNDIFIRASYDNCITI